MVFVLRKDVDILLDEGKIDEDQYIFLGSSEVHVPSLRQCSQDIPIIAEQILYQYAEEKELKQSLKLDREGKRYLKSLKLTGNYTQLKELLLTAASTQKKGLITAEMLRHAYEAKEETEASEEIKPLKQYLQEVRHDFTQAVFILNEEKLDTSANSLSVSSKLITDILEESLATN